MSCPVLHLPARDLLVGALAAAAPLDERRRVTDGVCRVLAVAQPATLVSDLTARADGDERPWALHALGVAALAAGDGMAATAHAGALLLEATGTEHEPRALGLAVRAAAHEEAEAVALGHLEALWALAPESDAFAEAAAVAVAAFPEADLDWAAGGAARSADAGKTGRSNAAAVPGLSLWPNPTAGAARISVPVEPGATLDVSIYDGLGRRVAVIVKGVETESRVYAMELPTDALAPGTYLVRIVVRGEGATEVSVARLTMTR